MNSGGSISTRTTRCSETEARSAARARQEIFLVRALRAALERLNPEAPSDAIDQAIADDHKEPRRPALREGEPRGLRAASRPRARLHSQAGRQQGRRAPDVIDWENPENNDFLLVSQLWIKSDLYERRTDLLGFVNGIPLVFIELKAAHRNLQHAYDDNLRDYRDTIPQIFVPNGFIVLSNGAETKVGTITSPWEHFLEWKKINSEGEEGRVSLETVIRGMCTPERLLDIVGNFTVFQELPGGIVKLVARNHQYLGVNNALARLQEVRTATTRLRPRTGPPERCRRAASRREAGCLLAHPRLGQNGLDDLLHAEGAADHAGELDLRHRHRPG